MGCDIHLFTEYKDENGGWIPGDAWEFSQSKWSEEKEWRIPQHLRPFNDRDYDFFGFLADVRNGTWGDAMPVLAEPKGLPPDVSERLKDEAEKWGGDGHSHSYFTLQELEAGWERIKDHTVWFMGAVDDTNPSPALQKWLAMHPEVRGEPPGGYCAYGSGPNGPLPKYRWSRKATDEIAGSYGKVREYLWNLAFEHSLEADAVRIVFWFDN